MTERNPYCAVIAPECDDVCMDEEWKKILVIFACKL